MTRMRQWLACVMTAVFTAIPGTVDSIAAEKSTDSIPPPPLLPICDGIVAVEMPRDLCSAREIKSLPVTNVADILKTAVGVTVRNNGKTIRYGWSREMVYVVKGDTVSDPLAAAGSKPPPPVPRSDLPRHDLNRLLALLYGSINGVAIEIADSAVRTRDMDRDGRLDLIDLVWAIDWNVFVDAGRLSRR